MWFTTLYHCSQHTCTNHMECNAIQLWPSCCFDVPSCARYVKGARGSNLNRIRWLNDTETLSFWLNFLFHYNDVIVGAVVSQITSITSVYWIVYSGSDQRKHQSSASLDFVWGIHWWPVNSPHKWPVTRKMFPFDDVIMWRINWSPDDFPPKVAHVQSFDCNFVFRLITPWNKQSSVRRSEAPQSRHCIGKYWNVIFRESFYQTFLSGWGW